MRSLKKYVHFQKFHGLRHSHLIFFLYLQVKLSIIQNSIKCNIVASMHVVQVALNSCEVSGYYDEFSSHCRLNCVHLKKYFDQI